MLSMFKEKDQGEAMHWSMTRVVAFMFAVTICYSLVLMARGAHAHDIGWPYALVAVVTLLAVPLQLMFKLFQSWISSAPGQSLLRMVMQQASLHGLGPNSSPAATVNVGVGTHADPDK